MTRGVLKDIGAVSEYGESAKVWLVSLQDSALYWHKQIAENRDAKALAAHQLRMMKQQIAQQLDKRVVYFIASRRRVRFSMGRPYEYQPFSRQFRCWLELGRACELRQLTCKLDTQLFDPGFQIAPSFIQYMRRSGAPITLSIHDFLHVHDIRLGLASRVHYVGYTGNPESRILGGRHRGMRDIQRVAPADEYDIFHYYNVFKVISFGEGSRGVNFLVSNAMLDEVNARDEGQLVEKMLIYYFWTETQALNRKREVSELKNRLIKLAHIHNVRSVRMEIKYEPPGEYFRFYSTQVPLVEERDFTMILNDGAIAIAHESFVA